MPKCLASLYVLWKSALVGTSYFIWRLSRMKWAGRILLHALEDSEPIRMLAGMLLVKGKEQALPLLMEAVRTRYQLPTILTMLGDVGDARYRHVVEEFTDDADPRVALAAREAIRIFDLQLLLDSGSPPKSE